MKLRNLLHLRQDDIHIIGCLSPLFFYHLSDIGSEFIEKCYTNNYNDAINIIKSKYPYKKFCEFEMRINKIKEKLFVNNDCKITKGIDLSRKVSILTLNATRRCNLKCSYCFEDEDYRKKSDMPFEIARKAIDTFFTDNVTDGVIVFTGGEPMLNYNMIKKVVNYVDERNLKVEFRIKTNATLLDNNKVDFLISKKFKFQVSLDGCEAAHDTHRKFPNGRGSFKIVDKIIRMLMEKKYASNLSISATTTHQTIKYLKSSYTQLNSYKEVAYDLKPVMPNSKEQCVLSSEDYKFAHYNLLNNNTYLLSTKSRQILDDNKCICGIGIWNITIDVDGKIYPCYRMCGNDKYIIGTLDAFSMPFKLPEELQIIYHLEDRNECSDCFFLPICKKGCYTDKLMDKQFVNKCFLLNKKYIIDILYKDFITNDKYKLLTVV